MLAPLLLAALPPLAAQSAPGVDFDRDVGPLLAARCTACHGPEKQRNDLRLDRRAAAERGGASGRPAVVPGDPGASRLIAVVSGGDPELRMPPEGEPLTADEVDLLRRWIAEGADWGSTPEEEPAQLPWALRPLARPRPPSAAAWLHPIDRFVLARLAKAGIEPAPEADRATLIRRMSLLLRGLPPAPEELEEFVTDPRPDAYGRLIERQLGSPRYGERWARHWLDLARFAETHGFETNTPRPHAWPYRDYVIRAFNEDVPFDRFAAEQLAGDALGVDEATGFLVGGPYDTVLSPDVELTRQQRQDELADMVGTTSTAFLGLTVACARCHDHKFDPIRQTDYYAVQAVFAGVRHGERPLRPRDGSARLRGLAELERRVAAAREGLDALPRPAGGGRAPDARMIDDEAPAGVALLRPVTGHGANPPGTGRGRRSDPGDLERLPNLSRGRYSWWDGAVDEPLIAYAPGVQGRHRIWLSWGCGWDTHALDAVYDLDRDGDLATAGDRVALATVDQRRFADGTLELANQPLWSGLLDAGVHELGPASRIVLRAGSAGRPVTADAIVVQEAGTGPAVLPRLSSGVDPARNAEDFEPVAARSLRFRVLNTERGDEPCLDELELWSAPAAGGPVNVARSAAVRTSGDYAGDPKPRPEHLNDGLYGNGRSWISDAKGSGWVVLELPEPALVDRVVWGRDRDGVYADRLARDYVIEVAVASGAWRAVADSGGRLPPGTDPDEVPAYRYGGLPREQAERAAAGLAEIRALESELAALEELPPVYACLLYTS